MKTVKTYGVYGMVEKSVILNHKGASLHIMFTGGSMNANGVIPAKYTTGNPVFQFIIESSEMFRLNNIRLVRVSAAPGPGDAAEALSGAASPAGALSGAARSADDAMKDVEVTDIESDARQYLVSNYGVKAHDLRSKSQIIKEGVKLGVRFILK